MVRVKSRYLLCEVNVSESSDLLLLDERAVAGAVRLGVARMHGDYGAALCNTRFSVKYLNAHTGMVFIRSLKAATNSSGLHYLSLPILKVEGEKIPCFLNCLHVGGTIRTCQKFLIRYNAQQLHRILPKCKNEAEKDQVRQEILNCRLTRGNRSTYEDEDRSDFEEDERE